MLMMKMLMTVMIRMMLIVERLLSQVLPKNGAFATSKWNSKVIYSDTCTWNHIHNIY